MATDNFRGQAHSACAASDLHDSEAQGDRPCKPLFSPYDPFSDELDDKLIPGRVFRTFACSVYRIAGGGQVLVELLAQEASDDARRLIADAPDAPLLLGAFHRGQLHALLSGSLEALTRQTEQLAQWIEGNCQAVK